MAHESRTSSAVLVLLSLSACEAPHRAAGTMGQIKPPAAADAAPVTSSAPSAAAPVSGKNVSGQIVHFQRDKVTATEAMPPSLHGHGEALRAVWTAADGTTFAAGFMFTGTPVNDTGAVYRRTPGGAFQLVHSTRENELGRVWGRSATDVYAAGMKVLAHFDGKTWSPIDIPHLEGSISAVWGNATDLWVTAGHQYTAHVYHRDGAGVWAHELKTDVMLFNLGGAGGSVWAVGTSGAIFRRDKEGRWKQESEKKSAQYGSVWASAEDDVWVAGSELVHSTGDGRWSRVDLPVAGPVRYVWGRGKGDVLAGTPGGLLHLVDGQWKKTAFAMDSAGVSGAGDELFVAHNDIR